MNTSGSRIEVMLGGHDLEMETIAALVESALPGAIVDAGLDWGARASAYRHQILEALERGVTPVLVELEWDLDISRELAIEIDHHGSRAGRDAPTSLHQVFALLELPSSRWTRWYDLVAANDRGHVRAMVEMGATREEIREVRRLDLMAQGATEADFAIAREAVAARESHARGELTVVRLSHGRASVVADLLHPALGGPGYAALAVVSPNQINVWGSGELVAWLESEFPGGWYGGELPVSGFWGRKGPDDGLVSRIADHFRQAPGTGSARSGQSD